MPEMRFRSEAWQDNSESSFCRGCAGKVNKVPDNTANTYSYILLFVLYVYYVLQQRSVSGCIWEYCTLICEIRLVNTTIFHRPQYKTGRFAKLFK